MRRFKLGVASLVALGVLAAAALLLPATANAQIFVTNNQSGTIGEYNFDGSVLNASLVTGLSGPAGIAISGSDLFVANGASGTIGKYTLGATPGTIASSTPSLISGISSPDALVVSGSNLFVTNGFTKISEYNTSGGTVNASLITGLNTQALAVSGSNLFVMNSSTIGKYTTSGGTVNSSFITGVSNGDIGGFSVSGTNLFVVNGNYGDAGNHAGSISDYDINSGATVNNPLLTGLNSPAGTATFGNDLFVADLDDGTVGEYTTSGGTLNSSLISGLSSPVGIAVLPEPSAGALLTIGSAALLALRPRRYITAHEASSLPLRIA